MTAPGTKVAKATTPALSQTAKVGDRSIATEVVGMDGLLALALKEKAPVEALERLVALKERMDAKTAAEAFFAAKAEFQRRCPRIDKKGVVDYTPERGGRVHYSYAPLDDIDAIVRPLCNELGLSYAWNSKPEGSTLVTSEFILRHIGGHSESSSFSCPTTSKAGMSDQQRYGAAVKYSMRWSMILGLGLITTEEDDDRAEVDPTPINADQLVQVEELLEARRAEWKHPDRATAKFLAHMGVEKLAEIRASDFPKAVAALTPSAPAKETA